MLIICYFDSPYFSFLKLVPISYNIGYFLPYHSQTFKANSFKMTSQYSMFEVCTNVYMYCNVNEGPIFVYFTLVNVHQFIVRENATLPHLNWSDL